MILNGFVIFCLSYTKHNIPNYTVRNYQRFFSFVLLFLTINLQKIINVEILEQTTLKNEIQRCALIKKKEKSTKYVD